MVTKLIKKNLSFKKILKHKKKDVYKIIYNQPIEIKLSLFDPEQILKKSSGEVCTSKTLNSKTYEPEDGGLFCNKIFKTNSKNNYICNVCSYRQSKPYRCLRCGSNTKLDKSNIQNLSMGHIELISPIPHPWLLRTKIIHRLAVGLNNIYDYKEIDKILLTDPETIYNYFEQMDLLDVYFNLRNYLINDFIIKKNKKNINNINIDKNIIYYAIKKKIRIITTLIRLKQRPEWFFLKRIPVLSPTYRPLMKLDDKLFVASDINFLYQNIIERNNILKELLKRYSLEKIDRISSLFTEIIDEVKKDNPIIKGKINLQKAVTTLMDSSFIKGIITFKNKSLIKRLSGKKGRFRKDILGKRINFSGRTVITSGPRLHLNQCGLPIELVLELFKPFIILKMRDLNICSQTSLKNLKTYDDFKQILFNKFTINLVFKLINSIISKHPVLLNRAPTLHRMNIQTFSPLLIYTKAIQLHPLVCSSFNADFDGDTMAIYIPHTLRSQIESRVLMMSSTNIISPSTQEPIISPTQDIVFGLYYATVMYQGSIGEGRLYGDVNEIKNAINFLELDLHSPISFKLDKDNVVLTTSGRILLYYLLLEFVNIDFKYVNKVFDKKEIVSLIKMISNLNNLNKTSFILDQIMSFGFYYAYKAGISLHKNDINTPNLKELFVYKTKKKVEDDLKNFSRGIISIDEKSKRLLNEWSKCSSILANQILKDVIYTVPNRKSSIYMLINSGARGSMVQMRQLCGIRGLMIKPSGDILEIPIISNFKEGLSVVDYFNSTHGARKGVIDTSLKTAASGYLTRKLFYAAKDLFITEIDCGTRKGIIFGNLKYQRDGYKIDSFYKNIVGRILVRNIKNPYTGEILVKKGLIVTNLVLNLIIKFGIEFVVTRSPMTCETRNGICRKCYGSIGNNNEIVSLEESIGIIAAQSIGEPGTQLTMRTFHQGGTVLRGANENRLYSSYNARVLIYNRKVVKGINSITKINIHRNSKILLFDLNYSLLISYKIPYGATLYVDDGSIISKGTLLFDYNSYTIPILSNYKGNVFFQEKNQKISSVKVRDSMSGIVKSNFNLGINNFKRWFLVNNSLKIENINMSQDLLNIMENSIVKKGDVIGRINISNKIVQDITGGLSKISKLFECIQNQSCLITPVEGYIKFNYEPSVSKFVLYVLTKDEKTKKDLLVRIGTVHELDNLFVRQNDYVYQGDLLSSGIVPIREIAEKIEFESSFYHLLEQIQSTYFENGVTINQKHIEVIISQMFFKITCMDLYLDKDHFINETKTSEIKEKINIKYKPTRFNKDFFCHQSIRLLVMGLLPIKGKISLGGISQIGVLGGSFLSSASFQKTSKVLTEAALWKGFDPLIGAQPNLFFGSLMPIGTGLMKKQKKKKLNYN
uniref:DNA-directed RNA polymerase subunit n=1 Tax=Reclinomonas americana TaxID=48483 RepID=O21238_RECAM|nr:RNA polymerase subunit beta' [Reclinomonas americana]AAD11865.1 RNA polymerase subunit beta' [Reclinomonas americana]